MPTEHIRSYWPRYTVGCIVLLCAWLMQTGFSHLYGEQIKHGTEISEMKICDHEIDNRVTQLETHYRVTVEGLKRDQGEMKKQIGRMADDVSDIKALMYRTLNNRGPNNGN